MVTRERLWGKSSRMRWLRCSQIGLVLLVLTLGCRSSHPAAGVRRQTGGSESVWTRSIRTPAAAAVATAPKKTVPKKEEKSEEKEPTTDQPVVKAPEKQEKAKPEKAPPAPKQTSELIPRLKADRPASKEEIAAEESLMGEITGLIIEQTMTRIGYDFYEYFFLLWEEPRIVGIGDYNIYINERASPLWGCWVWITVNDAVVWNIVNRIVHLRNYFQPLRIRPGWA